MNYINDQISKYYVKIIKWKDIYDDFFEYENID